MIGGIRIIRSTRTLMWWRTTVIWCFSRARSEWESAENGYLEVMVEQSARYEIELRRWPKEEDRAIVDGIEESDEGWRSDIIVDRQFYYTGGKALPFTQATLTIGDQAWTKPVGPKDKGIVFIVNLSQGETRLVSSFSNGANLSRGAYYVYGQKGLSAKAGSLRLESVRGEKLDRESEKGERFKLCSSCRLGPQQVLIRKATSRLERGLIVHSVVGRLVRIR